MASADHVNPDATEAGAEPAETPPTAPAKAASTLSTLVVLGVFAVLIWHVHVRVAPLVIFHGDMVELPDQRAFVTVPIFAKGMDFFSGFLSRPGGLAEWAGARATQYFATPYAGTVILIFLAAVACVTTNRIVTALSGRPARYTGLLPALILTAIWSRYVFHLGDGLAVGAALLAAELYLRLRRPRVQALALAGGIAALYYVIGAPAMLVAALCGLAELLRGKWWRAALALAVGAAAPALGGMVILGAGAADAYARMSGLYHHWELMDRYSLHWVRAVLWSSLYGACLLAVIVGYLSGRRSGPDDRESPPRRIATVASGPIAAMILTGFVLFGLFDARSSLLLRIHFYAMQGQWQNVLAEADRYPQQWYPCQTLRHIHRALFERGRLGDRMFAYPQVQWGLFVPAAHPYQSAADAQTLLRMGLVNRAEHTALELLEHWGPRPTLLRVLAKIFIAKGETAAAKVFLTKMTGDLSYGLWAETTLTGLADDPLLSDDPEIRHIRSMMLTEETFVFDLGPEASLMDLLAWNPANRMAFEYLMAAYFLHRPSKESVVAYLGNMVVVMARYAPAMKYRHLPAHYAEAAVLFAAMSRQEVAIGNYGVNRSTVDRFRRSLEIMRTHGRDLRTADAVFAQEMPDSFFRYISTGRSGGAPHE